MDTPKFAEMLLNDFPHAKKHIQRPKTSHVFLQLRKILGLWRIPNFGREKRSLPGAAEIFSVNVLLSLPPTHFASPPDITFPSLVSHTAYMCPDAARTEFQNWYRIARLQLAETLYVGSYNRPLRYHYATKADVSENRLSTHGATGNWEKVIYVLHFPSLFLNLKHECVSLLLALPIIT